MYTERGNKTNNKKQKGIKEQKNNIKLENGKWQKDNGFGVW